MTEVSFHFNAADKIAYACRLIRKACGAGVPPGIVGPDDALGALDRALWTFSALDFIAHCRADADASMRAASAVVLASRATELERRELLIHLGGEVPGGFERFKRLIEIVGMEADDIAAARQRWRYYADRGYVIESHDLQQRKTPRAQ